MCVRAYLRARENSLMKIALGVISSKFSHLLEGNNLCRKCRNINTVSPVILGKYELFHSKGGIVILLSLF